MYSGYPDVDPQEMSYHELMMHSVRARQHEIDSTASYSLEEHVDDLRDTFDALDSDLSEIRLTEGLRRRVESNIAHLKMWAAALEASL